MDSPSDARTVLAHELADSHAKVVWSHKIWEKDADIAYHLDLVLKYSKIALSVATTGSILADLLQASEDSSYAIIAAVLSAALSFITLLTKDIDYAARSAHRKQVAAELWQVREEYYSLISDLRAKAISADSARTARNQLRERLAAIYRAGQVTSPLARWLADRAIRVSGDATVTQEERTAFLPPLLRGDRLVSTKALEDSHDTRAEEPK